MNRNLEPNASANAANERFVQTRLALSSRAIRPDEDVSHIVDELSAASDRWITQLWSAAGGGEDVELLALGGFGRSELCHGSDLDLVIEVPEIDADLTEIVQRFRAWSRPTKTRLAHAVRTPEETIEQFGVDVRTAISYLDARSLRGGDTAWPERARQALRGGDGGLQYVERMLEDHRGRLRRFGQTIYLLEPDLKSGKGALRDLHVLCWAARVVGDFDALAESNADVGWTSDDASKLADARRWLLTVRCALHALHGRKHDRFHFADQQQVAELLGQDTEFMLRHHYQTTRRVARWVERALRGWGRPPTSGVQVGPGLELADGQLRMLGAQSARPRDVIDGLRAASEHDVLLDPATEDGWEIAVASWSAEQVADPDAADAFVSLLVDPASSPRTSHRLLELGVIARFVPEFEPVVCHVQHDVYHVYTTDIHLLKCLEFTRDVLSQRVDIPASIAEVARSVSDHRVLLLAALFHDIGKNRGGGHSEKGAAMMQDIGPRLGLSAQQTDLLSFLVREHLTLSHVARRHDIGDRRVVRDLAGRMRTVATLQMLTVLTYCDMSTVGQKPISDWNTTLVVQLHNRLEASIRHGVEHAWQQIAQAVDDVRHRLRISVPAQHRSAIDAFIRDVPADYLVETSAPAVRRAFDAWARGRSGEVVVRATPETELGVTEVIVSSADIPGALARITGAFSSEGLDILAARIITTATGRLLDIFRVTRAPGALERLAGAEPTSVFDEGRLRRLEQVLLDVLNGTADVEALLARRASQSGLSPRETPPVPTSVEEVQDLSDDYTVIQVKAPDRLGLLYDITRTLSECDVDIRLSKIDVVGAEVVDTFYIETLAHQKLDANHVVRVIDAIRQVVGSDATE